jgi:hypothetical protein
MGIRGTAPHVEIMEDGSVKFLTLIEQNKKKPLPIAARRQTPSSSEGVPDIGSGHKICRNC